MTPLQILGLILTTLESLEKAGHITIGGWDKDKVDGILEVIQQALKSVPGSGGFGAGSPGTDIPSSIVTETKL